MGTTARYINPVRLPQKEHALRTNYERVTASDTTLV